jgi:glucuronate isomerase
MEGNLIVDSVEKFELMLKNVRKAQAEFAKYSQEEVDAIFKKALAGEKVTHFEMEQFKTSLLVFFAKEYAARGWVMQLHFNVMRNINGPVFRSMGPDMGFDVISTRGCCEAIAGLLNAFQEENAMPRVILYSLNPADNELLDTIIGAFQGSEVPGKIQHGSAWWFSDTKTGMEAQLTSLANLSILGNFVGMLTDSRSFLSYTRHEYFRRIFCNVLGEWIENGEYPYDEKALREIVEGVCYKNAKRYFEF